MGDTAKKQPSDVEISMPKCPTCGALSDPEARPFCSRRCADIDLGYWIQGKYAIPAVDAADDTIVEALMTGDNLALYNGDN
mgnify:CR=1 FL=1